MKQLYKPLFGIITILFFSFIPSSWGQETYTYNYTGAVQTYVVPAGITTILVETAGGDGFGPIGEGGMVEAIVPVTPGETLQIYVGGEGSASAGGFNGGGTPGVNATYGGGGGASDIRVSPYGFANRIIVAGGGGGSASNCGTWTAEGGHGGGLVGESGCLYSCSDCQYTGGGGTQISGGIAGPTGHGSCGENTNGSFGQGGNNTGAYGVGGGGGYYGGGSGCFEGAGGGSSYTHPDATDVVHTIGGNIGNGYIIITELCVGVIIEVSDYDLCVGEELTLTGESITGGTVMWDDGIVNGVPFVPAGIGSHTYTGISTSGTDCLLSVEVVVHGLPAIVANADPETVCLGQDLTLSGSGGAYYEWSPGDIENGVPFTPGFGTMTYTVEGEDWYGCFNTAEVTVDVIDAPVVSANATDDNICLGESITLTGSGAVTYEWDMGVEDGVSFTPETTGTFVYNVDGFVDGDGCFGEASIEITVNEVPTIESYITTEEMSGADGGINITVTGGTPAYDFDWDNDGAGEFGDPEDLTGIAGGTYIVVVKDANECEDSETIAVNTQLGVKQDNGQKLTIYPNPTNGIINLIAAGQFTYELTDLNGKLLISGIGVNTESIDLSVFSKGIYMIKIQADMETSVLKIIKE